MDSNLDKLADSDEASETSADEVKDEESFPVVGIGASAGGLEAFQQLFAHLPADTGMAYVLVQHLDPNHESRLTDLVAKATRMPVREVTQGLRVERNHVYVISPNTNLAIADGHLHITPRGEGPRPHLPIDYLFRSLAEGRQSRAIAVVLSGTGSDGTLGLCEVKAVGGLTFVQDEKTAKHAGMPRSAIESGCVDFILTPKEIAERLAEIGRHPYLTPSTTSEEHAEESTDELYKKVLTVVRTVSGVDFTQYRDTTIKRRIMRRMALHTQKTLESYLRRLESDRDEVESLYHDLLINVTSFFRDPELFEALKTTVFPEILKGKTPATPIRVWVPGCSTGQESYSVAMSLLEFFDDKPIRPPIQIFATDLSDQRSLDKARAGVYPESIEGEVSPERLRRFFKKEDHIYRINKDIRDLLVFARHNVTADPPFSHLDMISCRNVLIYLSTPLQKRVIPTFHYALNSPGFLVLGTTETVGEHTDLFDAVDRNNKIYSKKQVPSRPHFSFPIDDYKTAHSIVGRRQSAGPATTDFQREADRIMLGRYAPPGVLVNENLDIIQFRGRTSPYLEVPPGEPTTNLMKMAREGLFLELRSAIAESKKQKRPVQRDGVRIRVDGGTREIGLEVCPIKLAGAGDGCVLILFHETPPAGSPAASTAPPPPEPTPKPGEAERDLVHMRQELIATKEFLQSLVEQQDAANEELRSANEEILSSNDELQSTNEELETAKEELQSANEELTTVNEQLHHRNLELNLLNNDLTNLLSSTNIPVVMVGSDLRIRRFTVPAKKVLSLLPTDIGRPIGDIKGSVEVPDMEALLMDVIEKVQVREKEVQDRDGKWYALRVHPYRTVDHKIDGAVIILLDIDQVRHVSEEVQRQAALLGRQASLLELSQEAIIVRDARNAIVFWNRGAEEMYGWTAKEAQGQSLAALLRTDLAAWATLNSQLDQTGSWEGELRQTCKDGTPILVQSREVLVRDESGERSAVLAIKRDITELKRVAQGLKDADRRKDEFLATLAHELRNPLAPICNATEIIRLSSNDPPAIAAAREILSRQVGQLSRIVEDLIDVSRIVERKIALRRERINLAEVVRTAVETCTAHIESSGHRLTVTLPPEPLYVDADPARLVQVLTNLLNNAAKYTDKGGELRLTVATTGGGAEIHVSDNGIGIPPELLPNVFDMFVQGERSGFGQRSGLCVGLSLVKNLVQMHGGSVDVKSDGAGKGSEFIVRLPLASANAAPSTSEKAPAKASGKAAGKPRRILVVDDNRDQADSMGVLLELLGHEVRIAYDGPEAITVAAAFVPEIALVDIGLPGLSGYEVARRIRAIPALAKIVLVAQTGWGQEEDRRRSHEAGFDHHLVKPVDPTALKNILLG